MPIKKDIVQGDIWSKGLSKFNETYFFFHIENPLQFTKNLRRLASKTGDAALISTLTKAEKDQNNVALRHAEQLKAKSENTTVPKDLDVSGAVIAFTRLGLEAVSTLIGVSNSIAHIARFKMFSQTKLLYT
jgi:hypothetical protein